jgi:hypothetical protein
MSDLRLADDTVLAVVTAAADLPAFEQAVFAKIDGVTPNREVARALGLASSDLQVALTALLARRAVEVRTRGGDGRTDGPLPRTDTPRAGVSPAAALRLTAPATLTPRSVPASTSTSPTASPSTSTSTSTSPTASTPGAFVRPGRTVAGLPVRVRLVAALEDGKPAAARLFAQEAGIRGPEWELLVEQHLGLGLAPRDRRAFVRRYVVDEPRSAGAWSLLATLLDGLDGAGAAAAARRAADLVPSSITLAERAREREAKLPRAGGQGLFSALFGTPKA